MCIFEILEWQDVEPIWNTHLWPGRESQPVTSMVYMGGYNMEYKNEKPVFIGMVEDPDQVVAVNSYVYNEEGVWRSRGLWVHPDHRGKGFAKHLLLYMIDDVEQRGGKYIWTMPRREALQTYESVGFRKVSNWEQHDWGTNCYAIKTL